VLDKGLWAAMPAMHCGWQIFVELSYVQFLPSSQLIVAHRVSWWSAIHDASTANHSVINVMGWLRRSVAGASGTRKHVKTWSSRVSLSVHSLELCQH